MKQFTFSLQKLLDYKEQLFDAERTVLGDMRAVLTRMEAELAEMIEGRAKRAREFNERCAAGTTAQEMELHRMYISVVDREIQDRKIQIELQMRAIDKQMDKVRQAKIEISTIEKLREKKLEEYQYQENKANELFIEEFVSNTRASALSPAG